MGLKRRVFNQCINQTLTYGCQTWTLTKELVQKIEVHVMYVKERWERKILGIKQIEKLPNKTIGEKTGINETLEAITKTRWKLTGHEARMNDNRWTVRCRPTEWQVRNVKRARGRPRRRWRDDLQQWQRGPGQQRTDNNGET